MVDIYKKCCIFARDEWFYLEKLNEKSFYTYSLGRVVDGCAAPCSGICGDMERVDRVYA